MITKLKYVGICREDLIEIYILYIRSLLEYCSTLWHSSLTLDQRNRIENVQKLCLKVILGSEYFSYEAALELCNLETLSERREKRCLNFGLKSLLHPRHAKMFPVNPNMDKYDTRNSEHFQVNWASTEQYRKSAIPYIQRKLNTYVRTQKSQT